MQGTQALKVGDKVHARFWTFDKELVGTVVNTTAVRDMVLVEFERAIPYGHDGHDWYGKHDGVATRYYFFPSQLTPAAVVGSRIRVINERSTLRGRTGVVEAFQWNDGLGVRLDGTTDQIWFGKNEVEVITTKQPSAADDLRLTPQAKTVLCHLKKRGRISPAEANTVYGISRLASCIHEIRHRAGYTVRTEQRRDDHGHKYAKYILAA